MPIRFDKPSASSNDPNAPRPIIFQYSADGSTSWTETLDPAVHKYWRWSVDNGASFSPNNIPYNPSEASLSKFGWFNYNNSNRMQIIPGGVWTTIANDALGTDTITEYNPPGVDSMLDPTTGRILLDDLVAGDEVYIRHTINVIPFSNGTSYSFSQYFGTEPGAYRLPIGIPASLNEGGGIPTGTFLLDTHFFIKDENSRVGGMLPQVLVSNESMIEYTGCYISVNRR